MKRVTGIGGIFFSAKDPKALCAWYKTHLILNRAGRDGRHPTPNGYVNRAAPEM